MPQGIVKWFNNAKGYGFLQSDETGNDIDIFAHYSAIEMEGYKTLKAGQSVIFDLIKGDKGIHAANIRSDRPVPISDNQVNGNKTSSHENPVSAAEALNH